MAQTLEQIVASLGSIYDPQINTIKQRQALIPDEVANEEKGLQAKQETAFGDILGGARRRGLGFAGIPLAEQAKYTSTEFLPAIARLRQSAREKAIGLEDAVLGINERRNQQAYGLLQQQQEQDRWQMQFDEDRRRYEQQMAAARRGGGGGGGGGGSLTMGGLGLGGVKGAQAPAPQDSNVMAAAQNLNAILQQASGNQNAIISDYLATLKSANKGNAIDKIKIDLYKQKFPQLFPSNGPINLQGYKP